jgi:hypothetical protein
VEIVERNMSKADMRGIAILPGSKSTSRAKGRASEVGRFPQPTRAAPTVVLRTHGSLRGSRTNVVSSTRSARPSVTLKKNRSVETVRLTVGTPTPLAVR